jgi:hypothetical protein
MYIKQVHHHTHTIKYLIPTRFENMPYTMMLPPALRTSLPQRPQRRKQQQLRRKLPLTPLPCSPVRQYYNHEMNDNMTVLHLFCRSGSRHGDIKTIVELQPQLISHQTPKGGDTPLHFAVAAHDLDTTRFLLGINPEAASIKSRQSGNFGNEVTPLHVAILGSASLEIMKALVRASPRSVKVRDGNGQTAHTLAAHHYAGDHLEEICAHLHMYM